MTRDEAKRILMLHRPWAADKADPELAEALALTRQDEELRQWFEAHCAAQTALRSKLLSVRPPAGLKEQILSERPTVASGARRKPSVLVTVLALIVIFCVIGFWASRLSPDAEEISFDNYRSRMVRSALRLYSMDLETNSATEIRAYLAQNRARADYVLPKPLTEASLTGCGILRWQGNRVAMVCFRTGQPLAAGEKADLFLFVTIRAAVPQAPATNTPQIVQVNKLITASWTEGDLVYLLATPGDENVLRKFL